MIDGLSEIDFAILIVGIALLIAVVVLAILYATWRRAVYDFHKERRQRSERVDELQAAFRMPPD